MIEQLMRYVNNWFEQDRYIGTFTVPSTFDFLQEGQYFRVVGSVFNDGVYQYDSGLVLQPETFTGEIWALAVPKAFLDLSVKIGKWNAQYEEQANSPYSSESFGGYSYSKGTASGDGEGGSSWRSVFRSDLNRWRKI